MYQKTQHNNRICNSVSSNILTKSSIVVAHHHSCPQSAIFTSTDGLPLCDPSNIHLFYYIIIISFTLLSIVFTISNPSVTRPNTTCLLSSLTIQLLSHSLHHRLSYHSVFTVQIKNWDPFVFAPAFAIDNTPDPVCFSFINTYIHRHFVLQLLP
jgi:hypothetical protein